MTDNTTFDPRNAPTAAATEASEGIVQGHGIAIYLPAEAHDGRRPMVKHT